MKLKNKILIIEDDQLQAKLISNVLSLNDYEVCHVSDGASGIQKAFEYKPNLILCDVNMDPIDGFSVFNVLKQSTLFDEIPFIFITSNSDLADIRVGMALGADDYFVKPFNKEDLLIAIGNRLSKYSKLKNLGKSKFSALLKLSPNGIFLFDGHGIFEANAAFMAMLNLNSDKLSSYSIEDILDRESYSTIKEKIHRCSIGLLDTFTEEVYLVSEGMCRLKCHFSVIVYEKSSDYTLMVGLLIKTNPEPAKKLKIDTENLTMLNMRDTIETEWTGKQVQTVFRHQNAVLQEQAHRFFSKREIEVLSLSMEGLPTKLIADKLSISDRTVEKHRANLMEKTNSKNIIEVIFFAIRHNLIEVAKLVIVGFSAFLE